MPRTEYRTRTHANDLTREDIYAAVPKEVLTKTKYSHDSRVVQDGVGGVFVTDANDIRYHVCDTGISGWSIFGPDGQVAVLLRDQHATGFDQADHAIYRLIGKAEDQ